jgi:ribosomal-protein-alanine N-acetyltransferase
MAHNPVSMQGVELHSHRLLIRTPRAGDGAHYARYYRANRDFLQPFSPTFEPSMFSERDWEASIPTIQQHQSTGMALRFCLFESGELIGVANFTQMTRSPSYAAVLGYTLSEPHQGKGYMSEALREVLNYVFTQRNLHRVRAEYMPRNERSGRLLRALGFEVEGYARDHLLINGQWEDHILAARLNPAWRR